MSNNASEKLLDIFELAVALKVSCSTVERRIRTGEIPVIQTGRVRRFRLSDVMSSLESTPLLDQPSAESRVNEDIAKCQSEFNRQVEIARKRVAEMDKIDGFKERELATILMALQFGLCAPGTGMQFDAFVMLHDLVKGVPK